MNFNIKIKFGFNLERTKLVNVNKNWDLIE